MGCDLVVAVGRATVDGRTLFGRTCSPSEQAGQVLGLTPAHPFAPGEKVKATLLELPQARQTYRVLGCRTVTTWGYEYGLNEHQVAAGCTALHPALERADPGLLGSDLVRLALERSRTARQAVEVLTGLVEQYGQGAPPGGPARDNAFLIADPREAYAVETAGYHWVYQEIQEVRAVSGVRVVRQDWDRISHGLAPGLSRRAGGRKTAASSILPGRWARRRARCRPPGGAGVSSRCCCRSRTATSTAAFCAGCWPRRLLQR